MSIRIALKHRTSYQYDKKISLGPQVVRLKPAPHSKTDIVSYSLKVSPGNHFLNWQQDPFSNYMARFVFPEKTDHLSLEVELLADMKIINPFDFFLEEYAENIPFKYPAWLKDELKPFLRLTDQSPELLNYWQKFKPTTKTRTVQFLSELVGRLAQDVAYQIRMEPGVQTCGETIKLAQGSCRDSAYLLVQVLRRLNYAARFVSGYLVQLVPDVQSDEEKKNFKQDFTDLHAWAEVYLPGAGWVGLDATSGLFTGEGHIPLAATPEPASAAPITGLVEPAGVTFDFSMSVERLIERPRNTRPYSEEQWSQLLKAGNKIEKLLKKQKLRLTMGGEPTFVGKENRDSPQWNTDALGEQKYQCALRLLEECRKRFAPGGIVQFSQGKWYPGEVLPRWSMNLYWLKEQKPLWPALKPGGNTPGKGAMKGFATAFSEKLAIDFKYCYPVYEDAEYYEWKLKDFDSKNNPADDYSRLEFNKLERLKEEGLGQVIGFAIPLRYNEELKRWQTCRFKLPRKKLFANPGDSALGFRLPIDKLSAPSEERIKPENNFNDLPAIETTGPAGKEGQLSKDFFVTTLCVEKRENNLFVFLPPVVKLEHYLNLVTLVYQAANETGLKVYLEGYEPPADHRLNVFKVTPDPGVIEVNIHPALDFQQMIFIYENIYAAAEASGLTAEKFLLDGRITGTGGGNHITLGGPTPAESPFFLHGTLLRSLVTFWQHHPSLSYMFTGLFIGPTSQAPRVDESRDEILYELELALLQLDKYAAEKTETPPWVYDRLLRNFLVDITGNTHRAEICIDKLYSPDSSTGRLGLVELRSFEMPPHYQMCVAQQLLIRTLLVRFTQDAYTYPLLRWQGRLHDRYLLPFFLWNDFKDVLAYINQHEELLKPEWFNAFLEFRLPLLGKLKLDDIELELQTALQPWNVLGETVFQSATSRPVDSAIERVQVKLQHFNPERYTLTCNGFAIPLESTDTPGEFIAGIRYKGWNPPFTLHPYAPHSQKLVFSIYDHVLKKYLGGCTYFTSHPGGLNYEKMPVNHNEAEGRRISRFWNFRQGAEEDAPVQIDRIFETTNFDLLYAEAVYRP